MNNSKVFVSGAGGFVGSRLVHRLSIGEDVAVRALVHSISGGHTMRLSRLPIEIERGDILDQELMDELLSGCDAVVHCAHGNKETATTGTRNLLEASKTNNVESFVYLSSAAVHGHDLTGKVDESTPFNPDSKYAKQKVKAERVITDFEEEGGLAPTIFRPMIIYGPHSTWVKKPATQIQQGAVLAAGGSGNLNQIYIDNLIDAMILAIKDPEGTGETFLAVDDETITWRQYYRNLSTVVGDHPEMKSLSRRHIQLRRKIQYVTDLFEPPLRLLGHISRSSDIRDRAKEEVKKTIWARAIYPRLSKKYQEKALEFLSEDKYSAAQSRNSAKSRTGNRYVMPWDNELKMQSSTGEISNKKLKSVLDWEQRITYDESMKLIFEWLEYADIV